METGRISERSGGSPGISSSLSAKWEIRVILLGNHIAHRGPQNHPSALKSRAFSLRFSKDLRPLRRGRLEGSKTRSKRGRFGSWKSGAEQHLVHDPSGQDGEQAG